MEPTAEQLKARQNAANGVVSADAIGNTTAFKPAIPEPTPAPSVDYTGLLNSLTQQEQAAQAQADAQQKSMDANQSRQQTILERLGLRSSVQQQKEQDLGVTGLSQTVRDYRNKLATLEGQAATMRERVTEANRATGRSGYDLNLIESGAQRTNAIDRVSAAAMLQAAQGNLEDAKAEAQRLTDMEFQPLEQELKIKEKQYEQNKDLLTRYDAKAARAYEQKLQTQRDQIQMQKQDAKDKREITLTAINYGVDQATVSRMQQAKNVDEAISIAGTKLRDPQKILDLQKTRLEMALNRAQIANQYDQIRSRKADDAVKKANGGMTPAEAAAARKDAKEQKTLAQGEATKAATALNVAQDLKTKFQYTGGAAVGSLSGRLTSYIPGGQTNDFKQTHTQLKNLLTLDNLKAMRGTGTISNADMMVLSTAATKLDLSLSPGEYSKEVDKIMGTLGATIRNNASGVLDSDVNDALDTVYSTPIDTEPFDPNAYYQ